MGGPITTLVIELAALALADGSKRANLLVCADLDGIELYCRSGLDMATTKEVLDSLGVLQYFDGIVTDGRDPTSGASIPLLLDQPSDIDYCWVSKHLARSRERVVNLLTSLD